jgi:hypothetical protein
MPPRLGLVIDDGLHAPDANLAILSLGLELVRPGGWIVIEDISPAARVLWGLIASLLPTAFRATMIAAKGGDMFVVQRTE